MLAGVTALVATDEDGEALCQEWVLDSSGATVALGATRSQEYVAPTSLHLWTRGSEVPVVAFPEVTGWPSSRVDPSVFRVESLTSFALAR